MNIEELLKDKLVKPKTKTEILSQHLLDRQISVDELIDFAEKAKDPARATCIEALELATKQQPALVNARAFRFVTHSLTAKAPRVKWESARVIGNTAALHRENLDDTIKNLLDNCGHEGTVVRWSSAFALGEILKLKTKYQHELLPALESIAAREEKNSIRKIYGAAIKKVTRQTE